MDEDTISRSSSRQDELAYLINSTHELDVDEALDMSGPFRKFQLLVQIFFMYTVFSTAYHAMNVYFVGENIPWECVGKNSSRFCMENHGKKIDTRNINFTQRCKLKRFEWKYTKPRTYSYIAEFDLVCNKNSISALAGGAFFIGSAVAGVPCSLMADIYGRKVVLGASLFITIASSVGCSFVKEVWQLILLRGVIGAAQGTCVGLSFVYLGEFIPMSRRSLSSNIFQVSFFVSSLFLAAIAYLERNWRKLQLYSSFPSIISFIFLFLLPQSPRWLFVTGKVSHAEEIVQGISKFNGRPLPNLKLRREVSETSESIKKYTYLDLFRNFKVLSLLLAQCFMWFSFCLLVFGVTYEASNLGGNMYESFVLVMLPDLPCCFISIYVCHRFGRKKVVLLCSLLAGIFTGAIAIFINNPNFGYNINIFLSMTGKCFIDVAENGVYLWTFELFPTVVRTQGFGICLVMCRAGGAVAPFLSNVLQTLDQRLPYVVMGTMGLLSCLVGLILPETNNCPSREQYNDFFSEKPNVVVVEKKIGENDIGDEGYSIN